MRCPSCGRNEPWEDASFCPKCGQELFPPSEDYTNYKTRDKREGINIYYVVWHYWYLISLFLGLILFGIGFYIVSLENLASLADPVPWVLMLAGFMLFVVGFIRIRTIVQRKIYDE